MAFSLRDYTGIKKLGEGGMGVVYRATQTSLNRQIVIKAISPDLLIDADQIKMFESEAKVAGSLDHQNIIHIYDFGEDEGYFYIAMEYIDGPNLEQVLASGPYSKEIILLILLQALKGLHFAHQHGIVHCDIKPNNILIAKTGRVKIADFGMARSTAQVANLAAADKNFITTEYVSPEQAKYIAEQDCQRDISKETTLIPASTPPSGEKGPCEERDIRQDIWAVGVLLYRVLSGVCPFSGTTNKQVLHAILEEQPRHILLHVPSLPNDLARNIMACLNKTAFERLSTLEPLISSLQNFFFEVGIRDTERYIKEYIANNASIVKELEKSLIHYHVRKNKEYRSQGNEQQAIIHFEEAKKFGYWENQDIPATPQGTAAANSAISHDTKYGILLLPESAEESGMPFFKAAAFKFLDVAMLVLILFSLGAVVFSILNENTAPNYYESSALVEPSRSSHEQEPSAPSAENTAPASSKPSIDSLIRDYNRIMKESQLLQSTGSRKNTNANKSTPQVAKKPPPSKSPSKKVASASNGILKVTIKPSFSIVYIDDEIIPLTSLMEGIPLEAGMHTIFAQATGYEAYKDAITLEKNATRFLPITLKQREKNNGFLHIYSYPWSDIYIDGAFQGTTPTPKPIVLLEGEHSLVLKRDGFQPHSETVRISAGIVTRVQAQLEKPFASDESAEKGW